MRGHLHDHREVKRKEALVESAPDRRKGEEDEHGERNASYESIQSCLVVDGAGRARKVSECTVTPAESELT